MWDWLRGKSDGVGGLSIAQKAELLIALITWVVAWWLLWLRDSGDTSMPPGWTVIGFSLGLISLLVFTAFYISSSEPDTSMRTAVAATFVVFYLVFTTYLAAAAGFRAELGITNEGSNSQQKPFGATLFESLTGFMGIILAFYFAAGAVEKATKTASDAMTDRARIAAGRLTTAEAEAEAQAEANKAEAKKAGA